MATLVHDDVLDRAPLRRGRPTVFATGGRQAATATGDLLFSRAFAELAGTGSEEAVSRLSAASSALARGELMQRADAWLVDVAAERYLERCRLKTASLFDACCRLGALFGGTPGHSAELGRVRRGHRPRLPAARRRARRVRPGRAHGQAARHRPARRDRDAAAHPRPQARPRAGRHRPARGGHRTPSARRSSATASLPPARWTRRARWRWSTWRRPRSASTGSGCPQDRDQALRLVADGVVERYA